MGLPFARLIYELLYLGDGDDLDGLSTLGLAPEFEHLAHGGIAVPDDALVVGEDDPVGRQGEQALPKSSILL